MSRISEEELLPVLVAIRNLRAWAVRENVDPWTLRQGLIIALELDTAAALRRGIPKVTLDAFDAEAKEDAQRWISTQT